MNRVDVSSNAGKRPLKRPRMPSSRRMVSNMPVHHAEIFQVEGNQGDTGVLTKSTSGSFTLQCQSRLNHPQGLVWNRRVYLGLNNSQHLHNSHHQRGGGKGEGGGEEEGQRTAPIEENCPASLFRCLIFS